MTRTAKTYRDARKSSTLTEAAIVLLVSVCLYLGYWMASSYFEARAFNNVTGKNVSMWDAMFIELRVQESSKGSDG